MKRAVFYVICLGALLLLLGAAFPALASGNYNPIQASGSCSPKSIAGPQTVDVTITVSNQADGAFSTPVTLYDPNGTQVSFSGGVTSLSQQQKATYTGKWAVTAAELANGKIQYKINYNQLDENQNPIGYSAIVSVPISKAGSSSSKLTASYTISATSATKGQTVTLTYTLSNTSDTDMVDVTITNPNLTKDKVFIARISAGEKVTKNYQYTMGSKNVTSKPRVVYKNEGDKNPKTLTNIGTKTIKLEKGGITVNLKATSKAEVQPGEKVDLELTVTNSSNTDYSNVKITNELLGEIATGIELKSKGGKHTETKTVTVNDTAEYVFQVTGTGSDGKELDMSSNVIRLVALDMSKQLQLSVEAETETTVIYDEPAEIVFVITVRNIGLATGKDMVLTHGKTTIANIGVMEPGEERVFAKRLLASMAGTFQFSVSGINEQGVTDSVDGNELKVNYVEPTPVPPPPTPEPTETPDEEEEETPVSGGTRGEGGVGMILLWAIAGVLVLALAAVVGMIAIGRRQSTGGKKNEAAIDSIQRTARRDYTGRHKPVHAAQRTRREAYAGEEAGENGYEDYEDYDDAEYGEVPGGLSKRGERVAKDVESGLAGSTSMSELAALYGRPGQPDDRSQEDKASLPAAKGRTRDEGKAPGVHPARGRGAAEPPAREGPKGRVRPERMEPDDYAEEPADYRRRRRVRSADV